MNFDLAFLTSDWAPIIFRRIGKAFLAAISQSLRLGIETCHRIYGVPSAVSSLS